MRDQSPRFAVLGKLACSDSSRGAGREAAICDAVIDLLDESSYESVSMDAVASRAKASKATIYRRWANKNDLVVDALTRALTGHRDDVPEDTGSLRGDVLARIHTQIASDNLMPAMTAGLKALVFAAGSDPELSARLQAILQSVQLPAWQLILDRAVDRGEIGRRVDAGTICDVVQGQFCARVGVIAEPVDIEYVEHVVDDVFLPVIVHAGSKVLV